MADSLSLLFELDANGAPAVAEFQRLRRAFAAELDSLRKLAERPFKLPPVARPAAPPAPAPTGQRGTDADSHVKEFRRIEAEAAKSARAQEAEQRRLNRSVESLQKQRSTALIRGFKDEERAAFQSAKAQERAARQAAGAVGDAFRGLGPQLQSLGRSLTIGLTAPLTALGVLATRNAVTLDSLRLGLKTVAGSSREAGVQLARLREVAKLPGIGFQQAIQGSIRLQAVGFAAEDAEEKLRQFANAVALTGGGPQNLDQITVQLGQMASKSKVLAQDLKPIIEAAPAVGQALLAAFGTVDSEQIQKLGLSTQEFMDILTKELSRLPRAAAGARNAFDNFTDSIFVASSAIGEAILPVLTRVISTIEPIILRLADGFKSLSPEIQTAAVLLAGLAAALGPVLFIVGGIVGGIVTLGGALGTLAGVVAAIGFPVVLAGLVAIAAIVTTLVAGSILLYKAWQTNFGGIREITASALEAVRGHFAAAFGKIEEIYNRVLPTLQSITNKVLSAVAGAWDKYGRQIVAFVGTSFGYVSRLIIALLTQFGDFVDLIAKLIDGDFRGAWKAFARIIVAGVEGFKKALDGLRAAASAAFTGLINFLISLAEKFNRAAINLGLRLIAGLGQAIRDGAPKVANAMADMLVTAAASVNLAALAGIMAAKLIAAIRNAAAEAEAGIGGRFGAGGTGEAGIKAEARFGGKPGRRPPPAGDGAGGKGGSAGGADTATRQRIKALELEAERTEAIARQNIAAENIRFEQRKSSLADFTRFQIEREREVLDEKKKVYAAELAEAEKLQKPAARNLAVREIRLKELRAEIEFYDQRNRLLADQERQEQQSVIEHRQALLRLGEQADARELARLEDLAGQGAISAINLETERAQIEQRARARRRVELDIQLREAGENAEERRKILDEIKQLDAEGAASVEESERRKRAAIEETVRSYNEYRVRLADFAASVGAVMRETARASLESLEDSGLFSRAFFLRARLQLDLENAQAQHNARMRELFLEEQRAREDALKNAINKEAALAEVERQFLRARTAERARFVAEKRRLQEEEYADENRGAFSGEFRGAQPEFDEEGNIVEEADAAENAMAGLRYALKDVGEMGKQAFGALAEGLGATLESFILLGEVGPNAMRKLTAQILASLAKQALVKGLMALADGFVSLFTNPAKAAADFTAAAIYFSVAGAAALVGRKVAGDVFKDKQTSGRVAGGAAAGESSPNNRAFNYNGSTESASQAQREGSGGSFWQEQRRQLDQMIAQQQQQAQTNAALTVELARLRSMPPGDVVTIGAADATGAIGAAVISHSNGDHDFNERVARNIGLAR